MIPQDTSPGQERLSILRYFPPSFDMWSGANEGGTSGIEDEKYKDYDNNDFEDEAQMETRYIYTQSSGGCACLSG
jgi:hypothetical protein